MARSIFLTLLLINLVVLAWIYLNGESHDLAGREPQRAIMQLQPEKIRIVDPQANSEIVCQVYSGATIADAQELAKTWTPQFPTATFNVVPVPVPSQFEAVIAGFSTRAAATARLGELRARGVAESFSVRADDGGKFSLVASFADRYGAEAKQRAAAQKGVADVNVVEHAVPAANANIRARGAASLIAAVATQAAARNLTAANCP